MISLVENGKKKTATDRFAEIPLSLRCCSLCTCTRDTRNIIKRLRIEGKNVYLSEMK